MDIQMSQGLGNLSACEMGLFRVATSLNEMSKEYLVLIRPNDHVSC